MALICKYGGECDGCMHCYGRTDNYDDYYEEDDGLDEN